MLTSRCTKANFKMISVRALVLLHGRMALSTQALLLMILSKAKENAFGQLLIMSTMVNGSKVNAVVKAL